MIEALHRNVKDVLKVCYITRLRRMAHFAIFFILLK